MQPTLETYLRESAAAGALSHTLIVAPVQEGRRVRCILLRDDSADGTAGLPLVVLSGNVVAIDEPPPAAAEDRTDTDSEA